MDPQFKLARNSDIGLIMGMMEDFYAIDNYPFNSQEKKIQLSEFIENDHLGRLWLLRSAEESFGYIVLAFGYSFEYQDLVRDIPL